MMRRGNCSETSRVLMTHHAGQKNWLSLMLLTPEVLILCLQYFCVSFTWYFYITWLPTYLREGRGQTAGHAAALSVLPLLFGGFGAMLTGLAPAAACRACRIANFFGLVCTSLLLVVFLHTEDGVGRYALYGRGQPMQRPNYAHLVGRLRAEIGGSYTATVAATMNMLEQPGRLRHAGGWRIYLAENGRQLDSFDSSHDRLRRDCRPMLALPQP